ncbi:phage portal protein [Terasakiella sp.]|uniref:phage portal protein n=1 Tax=Terasakiella sp. TaxID=2034861 RepID=UPI003AA84ECC
MVRSNVFERTLASFVPTKGEQRSSVGSMFPFLQSFGITSSNSIGTKNALTLPAFYNGIEQITNDVAKLPKAAYRKLNDDRTKLSEHPVTFIINDEPNPFMTAFMFWKMMIQSAILAGNGIAIIHRNKNTGRLQELEFVHPDDFRDIRKKDGKLWYILKQGTFESADIYHIPGFSYNGIYGIGIITHAANVLNIAILAQNFSREGFENRGLGFAALETDKPVDAKVKMAIESSVNTKLNAPGSIKSVVLDEGFKYKAITINNQEAQLIEQGKFSVTDIARFLNISVHKLKVTEGLNYASLNMMNIEHTSDSIQPWCIKAQQECKRKLFTPTEKKDHYIKFNDSILMRADFATKAQYYAVMVYSGIMTRNEIRALEEMNALDGLSEPLTPVNEQLMSQVEETIKQMKQNEPKN